MYQEFIYKSRYSRWNADLQRREEWPETVDRYMGFMKKHLLANQGYTIPQETYDEVRNAILNHEVMPSMRALMTAGPALERNNIAGYNCAFTAVDNLAAFWEAMLILLNGTGIGYSVERQFVSQLPAVPANPVTAHWDIIVGDSKEGWVEAFRELITAIFNGVVPGWDTSHVRPAGARLKTFGGRASGPQPLENLFQFTADLLVNAAGRQLRPIEAHDLMCKIAEVIVVGGVRRSALISLSDLDDQEMAEAKTGEWWVNHPHRALANNSAVHNSTPSREVFQREWDTMVASNAGERGFFNREAAIRQVEKFGRRNSNHLFGCNPCSEILLRPNQKCNLSTAIIRATDTIYDLYRKVRIATILGTWQSTMTYFPGLRDVWRVNAEEERLLGVSMTGIMDHPELSKPRASVLLEELRDHTVDVNRMLAEDLGINASTAITCVKPEGTTSALTNTSSGIHARHSRFYIRTVRGDKKDPLTQFMIDAGVPHEDCVMKPDTTIVFSFPIKAPESAVTRNDMSALEQLRVWKHFQDHWCEHKPSCTVSVRSEEWDEVADWVYANFDTLSGISFLPHSDHVYQQAPFQEVDEATYQAAEAKMPKVIDWSDLRFYEIEDSTSNAQVLACVGGGGSCEI